MDLDAFSAVREPRWQRLKKLGSMRRLTGAEADEFTRLYQHTATDLAIVRSSAPDPAIVSRLSVLLASSRASLAGAREPVWRELARFLAFRFPAALYRLRWWTVATMIGFFAVAIAVGVNTATHPEVLAQLGSEADRQQYAQTAFAAYYSENPSLVLLHQGVDEQCVGRRVHHCGILHGRRAALCAVPERGGCG